MRRSLLVIAIVAVLSAWIGRAEPAAGDPRSPHDWVRTADGWEPRSVLTAVRRPQAPEIHPALVAAFQLGASLLVLLAFPGRAVPVAAPRRLGAFPPVAHSLRQAADFLADRAFSCTAGRRQRH